MIVQKKITCFQFNMVIEEIKYIRTRNTTNIEVVGLTRKRLDFQAFFVFSSTPPSHLLECKFDCEMVKMAGREILY